MTPSAQRHVEETNIVFVGEALLAEIEQWVSACEFCDNKATLALDYLLDAVTDGDPSAEYLMLRPVRCPSCLREVTERTLVVV